jgi:predicted ArsR family transcriptional regulator
VLDQPLVVDGDDALSQPTRARLFALLGKLGRAVGTVELAKQIGLHPNGVRLHLERLEADGLLSRTSEPQPRGRPRDLWEIAPDALPGGRPPRAYADLGRWLARAIGSRGLRGIEATGREIGAELASPRRGGAEETFKAALSALGFQPELQQSERGRLTVRLRNCPYRDAVRENQPAVCALHRGITRGLLDVAAPEAKLAGFEPRDPDLAGCLIQIAAMPGAGPSAQTRSDSSSDSPS